MNEHVNKDSGPFRTSLICAYQGFVLINKNTPAISLLRLSEMHLSIIFQLNKNVLFLSIFVIF